MSQLLIQNYLNEIDRLRKFSGSLTEGVISEAFKDLLKAWSRQNNLHFISQYEFLSPQKKDEWTSGRIAGHFCTPLRADFGCRLDGRNHLFIKTEEMFDALPL